MKARKYDDKYDYKKIVEEFEEWLKGDFCNKEIRGPVHFDERQEVQDKFITVRRKHAILPKKVRKK